MGIKVEKVKELPDGLNNRHGRFMSDDVKKLYDSLKDFKKGVLKITCDSKDKAHKLRCSAGNLKSTGRVKYSRTYLKDNEIYFVAED